jgi:lysophospholipase L1-like esterase
MTSQERLSSPSRRALLAVITVSISTVLTLGVVEYGLSAFDSYIANSEQLDPGMIRYDATLGWSLKPGWAGGHKHYDFDARYAINRYGFRGRVPSPDAKRTVAVFGDSFTFGQGVNEGESFVARVDERLGSQADVLNFGVLGYATDQALLLMRERLHTFPANEVWLVVYLANDLIDDERAFPVQGDHGKPFFALENGELALKKTPVPRHGRLAEARSQSLGSIVTGGEFIPQSAVAALVGQTAIARRLGAFAPRPKKDDA